MTKRKWKRRELPDFPMRGLHAMVQRHMNIRANGIWTSAELAAAIFGSEASEAQRNAVTRAAIRVCAVKGWFAIPSPDGTGMLYSKRSLEELGGEPPRLRSGAKREFSRYTKTYHKHRLNV